MSSSASLDGNIVPNGDMENTNTAQKATNGIAHPTYTYPFLALAEHDDDPQIRKKYRPFLLDGLDGKTIDSDWVSELELDTAMEMAARDLERTGERLKVMVLFGSLRRR